MSEFETMKAAVMRMIKQGRVGEANICIEEDEDFHLHGPVKGGKTISVENGQVGAFSILYFNKDGELLSIEAGE